MKTLNENVKSILAILIVLGFFCYIFTLVLRFNTVDQQVIIALVGLTSTATGYYFGSSSAASKKDETIASMALPATTTSGDININPNPNDNTNIKTVPGAGSSTASL